MAKLNSCFKRIFIFFNLLFAVVGGVVLSLGILASVFNNGATEFDNKIVGVIVLCIIGAVTMIISLLGAYGAYRENKCILIVFFVGMCLGVFGLLRTAVPTAIKRPQITSLVEGELHQMLPLDQAPASFQRVANVIQTQMKCCGLDGYADWRSSIPDSCFCSSESWMADECVQVATAPMSHRLLNDRNSKMVYKQPCGPIIMKYLDKAFDVMLGLFFGLAALALLGAVMSLVLLVQMRAPSGMTPVIFSVNPQPPKYTELFNGPEN